MMDIKSGGVLAVASLLLTTNIQAAPVFSVGQENMMGFHGVANLTGSNSTFDVGDIFYGIVNVNNIYTTQSNTSWNDNNTSAPYDNLTAYFAAEVKSVSVTSTPYGSIKTYTMGTASYDPNGVLSASDLAAKTLVKFYADTNNAFQTNGATVSTDIAKVIDGNFWASLGFVNGGYWSVTLSPFGNGTNGGINFINNNTGMSWGKVADSSIGCTNLPNPCQVDMAYESSLQTLSGGNWKYLITDPARVNPVPVPAAAWLFASGLASLGIWSRKKRG